MAFLMKRSVGIPGGELAGLVFLLAVAIAPMQAMAHPHVWVEMRSKVLLSADGMVTGVRVEWTTDPAYAKDALDGLDANGNGVYEPDELARLTQENLESLASYDYFVAFRFNGEPQKNGKATNGIQTYNANDGRLTLLFTVPLETPLDPHKGEIRLKVYDPEFFIDFEYSKKTPLLISHPLAAGCTANLMELPPDPVATQTKTMLATKGKDWKPDMEEDFGALFAQPVVIACTAP